MNGRRPYSIVLVSLMASFLAGMLAWQATGEDTITPAAGDVYEIRGGEKLKISLAAGVTTLTAQRLSGPTAFHLEVDDHSDSEIVDLRAREGGAVSFSSTNDIYELVVKSKGTYRINVDTKAAGDVVDSEIVGRATTNFLFAATAGQKLDISPADGSMNAVIYQPDSRWLARVKINGPISVDLPTGGTYRVRLQGKDVNYQVGKRLTATSSTPTSRPESQPTTSTTRAKNPQSTLRSSTSTSEAATTTTNAARGTTSSTADTRPSPTTTEGVGTISVGQSSTTERPTIVVSTVPATTPNPPTGGGTETPYRPGAAVNTRIPGETGSHASSSTWLSRLNDSSDNGRLTSDVTQNSYTVYYVDNSTPTRSIRLDGYFSRYSDYASDPDGKRTSYGYQPTITGVPVPAVVSSGGGGDGQILFLNTDTNEEWGFWQWDRNNNGVPNPANGYVYDLAAGTGRTHKGGRGAGVAKLFGLVRASEAMRGEIDHAIAVAFPGNTLSDDEFVYPATKSDGQSGNGNIPEGARLQLDPSLTDADFDRMGLTPEAKVIARAMQTYGLIVVDRSGRNKIFLESSVTGDWSYDDKTLEYLLDPLVNDGGTIDWNRHFRILDFNQWTGGPTGIQAD